MRRVLFFLLFLVLPLAGVAQDLRRAPTPDWVDEMPLPPDDATVQAQAWGGVHYLLSDHQIRWQGEVEHSYARTATVVTNRAGMETAATISFDIDPAFETVALVRMVVIRDGAEIDLSAKITPEVMRREAQLEDGILDGALTYWFQVPGVRVGDIVDYATVTETRPSVPGVGRAVYSVLEWSVPVVLSRTVVLWPEDWPRRMADLPERVARMEGPGPDKTRRLEFQRLHHIPPVEEEYAPASADPTAILRMTGMGWGEISTALTPHYAQDYPLTAEWEAKLAAIAAESDDPGTRAMAALRLVQDELRYISLSMGAGGYFARLPAEVIASGAGDCKDKALLLAVMLRRLGVPAAVALTDLDSGHLLTREVPMLGLFDHAILRLQIGDQVHWVDPTLSHQGGTLTTATPPDYGWALPLTGADAVLEPVAAPPERLWHSAVTERYRITGLGVFLEVSSEYRGGAADSMRERWANQPARDISDNYLGYYAERLPGLTRIEDIAMQDDRSANLVTMRETYFLPRFALRDNGLDLSFPFAAEDFAGDMPEDVAMPRKAPVASGAPGVYRHRIDVTGAPMDFTPPAALHLTNRAFDYRLKAESSEAGGLVLDWSYRATGADIPVREVPATMRDRRQVFDTTWFTWDIRP